MARLIPGHYETGTRLIPGHYETVSAAGGISVTVTETLNSFADSSVIDIEHKVTFTVTETLSAFTDNSILAVTSVGEDVEKREFLKKNSQLLILHMRLLFQLWTLKKENALLRQIYG